MLADIFMRAWADLGIPIGANRNPFRLMQLATVGPEGQPRVRTVVLRKVDGAAGHLDIYADNRSAKCSELIAEPRVALVAVDSDGMRQVRLEGAAMLLEEGSERAETWSMARGKTQALFKHGAVPGEIIRSPEEACDNVKDGFEHFAVIRINVQSLEWLDLSQAIHQRALFVRQDGRWQANWLVP